jgi:hypothetical protein
MDRRSDAMRRPLWDQGAAEAHRHALNLRVHGPAPHRTRLHCEVLA